MASFEPRRELRGDAAFWVSDDGDLYALREMYEFSPNVYRASVIPGMKVLDIGAHKGIFTVWAAKQGARVTAFEPNRASLAWLRKNLEGNGLSAEVREAAVGGRRGTRWFYADPKNSIGSTLYPDRVENFLDCDSYPVRMATLDDALGGGEWGLVKIDAEEAEYGMLLASKKLGQIRRLALEWHCPAGERTHPKLLPVVERLSATHEVSPIDYDWRIITAERRA